MRSNERSQTSRPISENQSSTLRFHRVARGQTLSEIAKEYYGDETFWMLLYGSNEAGIRKAGGLRPGLILYVPFM